MAKKKSKAGGPAKPAGAAQILAELKKIKKSIGEIERLLGVTKRQPKADYYDHHEVEIG